MTVNEPANQPVDVYMFHRKSPTPIWTPSSPSGIKADWTADDLDVITNSNMFFMMQMSEIYLGPE